MADKRDYYEVLGIPKTASVDDIKKAYRELARKYLRFAEEFERQKCRMSFITVVNIWIHTKYVKHSDPPDSQKDLLPETIFKVTAIKLMGDHPVGFYILINIGIQEK